MPADAPPPTVLAVPLDAIDATALLRDRMALDDEAFTELRRSILVTGLRSPVELLVLGDDRAPAAGEGGRYGLIAGYRRLMALRALRDDGHDGFGTIPAIIRDVREAADAYRLMVEENAVRADISPWERARLVALAAQRGLFPTIEAAVGHLHACASRYKQQRIRSIADLVDELDGLLAAPETLSERQLLRLAAAVQAGFLEPVAMALEATRGTSPERQWAAIAPYLAEQAAEAAARAPEPRRPGRPRRALWLRDTLAVRRERTPGGYVLRFSGPDATSGLLDEVLDTLEQMYRPRGAARARG
jgi:ParB family chromosome partitioning protein